MKCPNRIALSLFALLALASRGSSAVLINDSWADGTRENTSLPDESAWFSSNAGSTPTLSASVGTLTGNVLMFGTNAGSRLWLTHFTPAGSPADLAVGETIKATLIFIPDNVTASPGTGRGLRVGLFNFSEPGANRVSADGFSTGAGTGAPGTNVTGYMLNMNFGQAFGTGNPLQLMKRTDIANINLMGASAVYSTLGSAGGAAADPGFSNGVPYTMEFSVTRYDNSADIVVRFSNGDGWSVSAKVTDSNTPNFRFDTFAFRPNSVAETAESFSFTRFKAELLPFEVRIGPPQFLGPEGLALNWNALPGRTYHVEWRPRFDADSSWMMLDSVVAAGNSASLTDVNAFFEVTGFYRVVQLP